MTAFEIVASGAALSFAALLAWLLFRTRDRWPPVPAWDWIVILKVGAFSASVAGAGILTLLYWQGSNARVSMLRGLIERLSAGKVEGDTLGDLALALVDGWSRDSTIVLVGLLVIVLALGWLMTPRKFEFEGPLGFKGKLEGGESSPPPAAAAREVADAAVAAADQIVAQTGNEGRHDV